MATPLTRTPEGCELQLATNHLGHHALTTGLRANLAAAGRARVMAVSSAGHLYSPVVFEDVHDDDRKYNPWTAYGQSKTANILFAVELANRWADEGISANALMPGVIQTKLIRHVSQEDFDRLRGNHVVDFKTVEQGAATSTLLAGSPLVEGIGGRYFEDCNEAGPNMPGERTGYAPYSTDPELAARLWRVSEEMLAS